MAGLGRRFAQAGYGLPKYMLPVRGRSMFAHAVASFQAYFGQQELLIICRDRPETRQFVSAELAALDLSIGDFCVCALDKPTSGQAHTVATGLRRSNVAGDEPLTIFNIDTIRPGFSYPVEFDIEQVDGYLEVFKGDGEHWSFVRPEAPALRSGRVLEVTEKVRVSDFCSTGLYHFRSARMFIALFEEIEDGDDSQLQGGETYIAPLYNIAIRNGADIRYSTVDREQVIFCGTPAEYEKVR